MEGEETRCCCCFGLKIGVWLIGGMVIFSTAYSFYSVASHPYWQFYMISIALNAVFCVLFLIMMISKNHDSYKLRLAVFIYYLIGIVIIPNAIILLGVFGIGWNLVDDICTQAERQSNQKDFNHDDCVRLSQGLLIANVTFFTILYLYFSCQLKQWANLKKEK